MVEGALSTPLFRLHLVMFCVIITSDGMLRIPTWLEDNLPSFERLIAFIFTNTIQYPCTLNNSSYYSYKRTPPLFFLLDINPVLGHVLVHFVDKTHAVVEAVELIWFFLNILSFNFVPTSNKFLRLTIFIRGCVNRPAVVLTNHFQSYTTFLQNSVFS